MAKSTTSYTCNDCGTHYLKWVGKCTRCGGYSISESAASTMSAKSVGMKGGLKSGTVTRPAKRVSDISAEPARRSSTGISEFDRVLGGGIVPGQAILIAGPPGVGKSTIVIAVAAELAKKGNTVLIVSGEESTEQIGIRAKRMNIDSNDLFIADETDLSVALGHIDEVNPDIMILDSVQTVASPDIDGRAGSVSQVVEVSTALTRIAKSRGMPLFLIAHVTKDGNIAGPKTLEHLVDTVLFFEGDKHTSLRLLRVVKNRYGAADEVACFEQEDDGIHEVLDPSGLFMGERINAVPGTCVTVTMEGKRALLAEIQSLVSPTNSPNPRRGVSGLDPARMAMLVAVTEKHGKLRLYDKDTFLATVGGLRVTEPAADLAVCLALATATLDATIPLDVAAFGEVALSGDVRSCTNMSQRIAEAARLGFKRILVPRGVKKPRDLSNDVVLIPVDHLGKAFAAVREMQPR